MSHEETTTLEAQTDTPAPERTPDIQHQAELRWREKPTYSFTISVNIKRK